MPLSVCCLTVFNLVQIIIDTSATAVFTGAGMATA